MPLGKLGEAEIDVRINNDAIDKDLGQTQKKTKSKLGKLGGAIGGALKIGVLGTVGAAAAAAGAIGGLVVKYVELNNELKTAANRTGIAKDELHVLRNVAERLGSEDGLEGITDSAQELALRLQDMTDSGYRADEALNMLGLQGEKLRELSPKDALLQVITALQGVEDQQKKNWLADELMGGSWEHIAGVLNVGEAELAALIATEEKHNTKLAATLEATQKVTEATTKIKQKFNDFTQHALVILLPYVLQLINYFEQNLNPLLLTLWEIIQTHVIPIFKDIAAIFVSDILPLFKELIQLVGPILQPILASLIKFMAGPMAHHLKNTLVGALGILKGVLMIIIGILSGDFTKAWYGLALVAENVINVMLSGINLLGKKIVGAINGLLNAAASAADKLPFGGGRGLARKLRGAKIGWGEIPKVDLTSGLAKFKAPVQPTSAAGFDFSGYQGFNQAQAAGQAGSQTVVNVNNPIILDESGWTEQIAVGTHTADRRGLGN